MDTRVRNLELTNDALAGETKNLSKVNVQPLIKADKIASQQAAEQATRIRKHKQVFLQGIPDYCDSNILYDLIFQHLPENPFR